MPAGAAPAAFHHLKLALAHKKAVALLGALHMEQAAQQLCGAGSLGIVGAVEAHMAQAQIQHGVHSLAAQGGDLIPLTGADHIAFAHPCAAHSHHLLAGKIIAHILGIDAARAHPAGAF